MWNRWCWLFVAATVLLATSAEAEDTLTSKSLSVAWRTDLVSVFAPDLMVRVENRSDRRLVVVVKIVPWVCDGNFVPLSRRAEIFLGQLIKGPGHRSVLDPGEWTAIVIPLGLTVTEEVDPSEFKSCEHQVTVRTGQDDAAEVVPIRIQADQPPARESDLPRRL
jgi:hypothetical protein